MSVPESIRQVPRPSNTVVIDSGSNGPKRYAVHSRAKVVYTRGRNPRPVNGPVIGHIIGGKFVPNLDISSRRATSQKGRFRAAFFIARADGKSTDVKN